MSKQFLKASVLLMALSFLSACAATQVAVSKRHLDVQTKMSASLFMDPIKDEKSKTIYIQSKNSSDKADFTLQEDLESKLRNRGFQVVKHIEKANYILQVNVLQVGKSDPTAAEAALYRGYGMDGAFAAGATAYIAGGSQKMIMGASILGGIAAVVTDSLVKDVYYSVVTDVQIKERVKDGQFVSINNIHYNKSGTSGGSISHFQAKSKWKTYQTRILSSANKVNLEFSKALPELKKNLAQSIAGIF